MAFQPFIITATKSNPSFSGPNQCLETFLGTIDHNPSVSKLHRLPVVIFWFFFTHLAYIPYIPFKRLVFL